MGPTRFELVTSSLSGTRSNQLSYEPALALGGGAILERALRLSTLSHRPLACQDAPETDEVALEQEPRCRRQSHCHGQIDRQLHAIAGKCYVQFSEDSRSDVVDEGVEDIDAVADRAEINQRGQRQEPAHWPAKATRGAEDEPCGSQGHA